MEIKVICGFDYSLAKTFHYLVFSFSRSTQKLLEYCFGMERLREEEMVMRTLHGGGWGGLEGIFMVNKLVFYQGTKISGTNITCFC